MRFIKAFWADRNGATALEYGIMAAIIGAVLVVSISSLTGAFTGVVELVNGKINASTN